MPRIYLAEIMTMIYFRSEELEKERLSPVAQYVLAETEQEELSVMSNLNGEIRIFGITAKHDEPEQVSYKTHIIRENLSICAKHFSPLYRGGSATFLE